MRRSFLQQFRSAFFHDSPSLRRTTGHTAAGRGPARRFLLALTRQSSAFARGSTAPAGAAPAEDRRAADDQIVDLWRSSQEWRLPRLNRQTRLASTNADDTTSVDESPDHRMTIAMTALDRQRTYFALDVSAAEANPGDVVIATLDSASRSRLFLLALSLKDSGELVAGATVVDPAEWLQLAVQRVARPSILADVPPDVITVSVRGADEDSTGAWRDLAASFPDDHQVRRAILMGLDD